MKLYFTMSAPSAAIVFVDNAIHHIFKSIETIRRTFGEIQVFSSEQELQDFLQKGTPDIIFLNLDLAPNDAVFITKEFRLKYPDSPPYVIIYSQKQDDFVQELAFNSGADSFINFQQKGPVLKLYISNLLKRKKTREQVPRKKVLIDEDRYLIYKYGEAFQLPKKEFKLFELLYSNSDKFFSKPEIAEILWEDPDIAKKRTIDVHIYNIRQLFGKRIIQSQKGKGYRINRKVID